MIVSDARAFQSTLKMQIFAMRHQISIYGQEIYFNRSVKNADCSLQSAVCSLQSAVCSCTDRIYNI